MTPPFSLRTTPRHERLVRHLLKKHPELRALQESAFEILTTDPHNRTRTQNIRKLVSVPPSEAVTARTLLTDTLRRGYGGRWGVR